MFYWLLCRADLAGNYQRDIISQYYSITALQQIRRIIKNISWQKSVNWEGVHKAFLRCVQVSHKSTQRPQIRHHFRRSGGKGIGAGCELRVSAEIRAEYEEENHSYKVCQITFDIITKVKIKTINKSALFHDFKLCWYNELQNLSPKQFCFYKSCILFIFTKANWQILYSALCSLPPTPCPCRDAYSTFQLFCNKKIVFKHFLIIIIVSRI